MTQKSKRSRRREARFPWRSYVSLDQATGKRIETASERHDLSASAIIRGAIRRGLKSELDSLRQKGRQ